MSNEQQKPTLQEVRRVDNERLEDTNNSDRISENQQRSVFQWLRRRAGLIYMTAALSVATPFEHERMEAAEISPGATWTQGIETLRNGVLSDRVETLTNFYLDNQTKREKWTFVKEGDVQGTQYLLTDIINPVKHQLSAEPTKSVTDCEVHAHTLSAGVSYGFISTKEAANVQRGKHSVSLAPSGYAIGGDISLWRVGRTQRALKHFEGRGTTVEMRYGVVDAAGMIYYRPILDQDLRQEFPGYFVKAQQNRAILHELEQVINPLLKNLDAATLDHLHWRTIDQGIYDAGRDFDYTKHYSTEEIVAFKREDLRISLFTGTGLSGDIAQALLGSNPKSQKLYTDSIKRIFRYNNLNQAILDRARGDWTKKSMTIPSEQLTSTKEYAKLREAFSRNGTKIRFVPYSKIPNEPACAGADYKPE